MEGSPLLPLSSAELPFISFFCNLWWYSSLLVFLFWELLSGRSIKNRKMKCFTHSLRLSFSLCKSKAQAFIISFFLIIYFKHFLHDRSIGDEFIHFFVWGVFISLPLWGIILPDMQYAIQVFFFFQHFSMFHFTLFLLAWFLKRI